MRFFPPQPLRQLYKELYKMTIEELKTLNHRYEPEFIRLMMQQAEEERNLADYQQQIETLSLLRTTINPINLPQIDNQITTLGRAIEASETRLETIQTEIGVLANELRKINAMLEFKLRENHSQPEEPTSYNSPLM